MPNLRARSRVRYRNSSIGRIQRPTGYPLPRSLLLRARPSLLLLVIVLTGAMVMLMMMLLLGAVAHFGLWRQLDMRPGPSRDRRRRRRVVRVVRAILARLVAGAAAATAARGIQQLAPALAVPPTAELLAPSDGAVDHDEDEDGEAQYGADHGADLAVCEAIVASVDDGLGVAFGVAVGGGSFGRDRVLAAVGLPGEHGHAGGARCSLRLFLYQASTFFVIITDEKV